MHQIIPFDPHRRRSFRESVLARLAVDPGLEGSTYLLRLEQLLAAAEQAIGAVLVSGEIDDGLRDDIESVAWTAVNEIPLDVIDDLSVAVTVEAAERSGGDPDVVRAAVLATLSWYEGFWPFEHPDAVVQAVQFGNIAKRIPAPVFMANQDRRVTFSSTALDSLLHRPRGYNERHTLDTLFAQSLAVGSNHPTRIVLDVGATSNTLHLDVTVLPIQTATGIEYFGFVEDRTREIALEQMRDGVVAAISHELRTPLTAIIGYMELITDGDLPPDEQGSALAIVKSESELLLRLVSDIVDFSKLTAGAAVLRNDRLLVRPEIEAAIRRVFPDGVTAPSIDVANDVAVHFDRDRLGQLLTNLLTNARRYGGPNVEISARKEGGGVDLIVRDDGEGIPDAEIKTIFDPFVQGSRQHRGEGAGLGLAICAGIMQSAGGSLSVRNDPGAVFRAYFPH